MVTYIAEIGNNHNGEFQLAREMAAAAVNAGADYVKFQIYNVDKFIAPRSPYFEEFNAERLTFNEFTELKQYVEGLGGRFLATPFDEDSLLFFIELSLGVIKISSGDFNNWDLLRRATESGQRLILSTGGATLEEIDRTYAYLQKRQASFSILHCVIEYPAPFEHLNLRTIPFLSNRYDCPVGYSDHSLGIEAALGAIALGADIIEKHFTLDPSLPGGDNEMSVAPGEFRRMVSEGNNIHQALGAPEKRVSESERGICGIVRRKFHAKCDIAKDTRLSEKNLILLRPENPMQGIDANGISKLIDRRVATDIKAGDLITEDVFEA